MKQQNKSIFEAYNSMMKPKTTKRRKLVERRGTGSVEEVYIEGFGAVNRTWSDGTVQHFVPSSEAFNQQNLNMDYEDYVDMLAQDNPTCPICGYSPIVEEPEEMPPRQKTEGGKGFKPLTPEEQANLEELIDDDDEGIFNSDLDGNDLDELLRDPDTTKIRINNTCGLGHTWHDVYIDEDDEPIKF